MNQTRIKNYCNFQHIFLIRIFQLLMEQNVSLVVGDYSEGTCLRFFIYALVFIL